MSSGSYSSNKPDNNDDRYKRQYAAPAYHDASQSTSMQEGMTTEPSVGRFTGQEKANSIFSRKPSTPKNYDGTPALAGQSNHGVHYSSQVTESNVGDIVNLRPAPLRGDGKVNKGKK